MSTNLGHDLKWSFFVASAQSFKFNSLLRPLPNDFMEENGEIDINRIRAEIEELPDLNTETSLYSQRTLLRHVIESNPILRPSTLQEALQDVAREPSIHPVAVSKPPNHVFKVCWDETQELRWRNLKGGNFSHFGFHGSRLENFYSILTTGLHQHRNKNSLFGQGIYLSSELSLCLMYSPSGLGWKKSQIGPLLSCVALCEMIDHPDVKCALTEKPSRAEVEDSMGGNVPEKYFVVTNDDMVCVRYLFVYNSKANLVSPSITTLAKGWFWKHKTLLLFVVYICIVMIAGISGSSGWVSWKRWLRKVSKSYMATFVQ